ncbi:hypothetical protein D3C77_486980 [compost metagenome]
MSAIVRQINGENRCSVWSIESRHNLLNHLRFADTTDADQTHTGAATHPIRPDHALNVGDERLAAGGFDPYWIIAIHDALRGIEHCHLLNLLSEVRVVHSYSTSKGSTSTEKLRTASLRFLLGRSWWLRSALSLSPSLISRCLRMAGISSRMA